MTNYGLCDADMEEVVNKGLEFLALCDKYKIRAQDMVVGIRPPPPRRELEQMRLLGYSQGYDEAIKNMAKEVERQKLDQDFLNR
jgi:hypothetical protein